MRCRRGSAPDPRRGEAALTSDGILLLIIGCAVVAGLWWLGLHDAVGTEHEARAYADRTLHRLLFAHDAAYFASNLSALGRENYPRQQRDYIIYELTKLGTPSAPPQLDGSFDYVSDEAEHFPRGRYEASANYPTVTARFYLTVARHLGRWQIDYFAAAWKNKPASAAPGSL